MTVMESDTSVAVLENDARVTEVECETSVTAMENGTGTHKLYWYATKLQRKFGQSGL